MPDWPQPVSAGWADTIVGTIGGTLALGKPAAGGWMAAAEGASSGEGARAGATAAATADARRRPLLMRDSPDLN